MKENPRDLWDALTALALSLFLTGCPQKPMNTTQSLKTIEQHNSDALRVWNAANSGERPNGIACPKCGAELFDDTTRVLTSLPPQTPIFCKKCDYSSSRF